MVGWIIWFIFGIMLVVLLSGFVLPKVFLKIYESSYPVRDRALGKYKIHDSVSMLYEPSLTVKKYIKKYQIYVLSDRREKLFIGEWAQKVASISYDVIAYNVHNRIIGIYNVVEKYNGNKCTHATTLPEDTDFVSLRLISVEGKSFPREVKAPREFWIWAGVVSGCAAATVDAGLWVFISFVLQCLRGFSGDVALAGRSWASIMILTAISVAAFAYAVLVTVFWRKKAGYYGKL